MSQKYENWKLVTEADFVSMFIKTWFAYISTLREFFPEVTDRKGDKKYLNNYKDLYLKVLNNKFEMNSNIMSSLHEIYHEGRNIIMINYPEYYFWDFYRINKDLQYIYRDIPPNKKNCLVLGMNIYKIKNSRNKYILTAFVRFWGEYYKEPYKENIKIKLNITDITNSFEEMLKRYPNLTEHDYLYLLLDEINNVISEQIYSEFNILLKAKKNIKNNRIIKKYDQILASSIALIREIFMLNKQNEIHKIIEEMRTDINHKRNTYEIIQQRPINFFDFHKKVDLIPESILNNTENNFSNEELCSKFNEVLKQSSILWFLDFVYRLRNALFHEIINPLDEQWQSIFKNSYLVLKEIVDLNINELNIEDEPNVEFINKAFNKEAAISIENSDK